VGLSAKKNNPTSQKQSGVEDIPTFKETALGKSRFQEAY
jgi:hypothetical protein